MHVVGAVSSDCFQVVTTKEARAEHAAGEAERQSEMGRGSLGVLEASLSLRREECQPVRNRDFEPYV